MLSPSVTPKRLSAAELDVNAAISMQTRPSEAKDAAPISSSCCTQKQGSCLVSGQCIGLMSIKLYGGGAVCGPYRYMRVYGIQASAVQEYQTLQ